MVWLAKNNPATAITDKIDFFMSISFSNNSVCYFFVLLVVYSKGKIIPNSRDHTKQTNYQLFILKKDF
ncbi:MAG: hypothetical protein CMP12_12530 [Zunongwangia sp.]|uniref:Uncharacterized protein n=1 Tax=Zunongwangia profunda TaxID=398743 RepID=A0A3D5J5A4_9FLAO|nr:hypothetical protein [Zunongwangia sp.]HCV83265.1 hypothetical protein [Zunongwangia profunda]